MKKKTITLIIAFIFLSLTVCILQYIVELKNTAEIVDIYSYRVGMNNKGILTTIEKHILRGFTREFNEYNLKKENFHNLQILGNEGEMSFLYDNKFFISELSKEQIEKILDIAINKRDFYKVSKLGGF